MKATIVGFDKLLAGLFLSLVLVSSQCACFAGTIKCETSGSTKVVEISGDTATKRVSNVVSASDVAITGNRIDILFAKADLTEKESSATTATNRDSRLTGTLFHCQSEGTTEKVVTGYCFFHKGSECSELEKSGTVDTVTAKGETCTGHITSVNREHLSIETDSGTQEIPTESIETIQSPRVFEFKMPVKDCKTTSNGFEGDASAITFKPTRTSKIAKASSSPAVTKTPSGGGSSTMKKVIIATVIVAVIATAITLPIVLPLTLGHGGGGNNCEEQQRRFATWELLRRHQQFR